MTGEVPSDKSASDDLALSALEKLRLRLLDLSTRNRLLDLKHTPTAALRIIDELPNQLYEVLSSEQAMRFLAVPEPTKEELRARGYFERDQATGQEHQVKKDPSASEWASVLGLSTGYEMPMAPKAAGLDSYANNAIQTLLYPPELETRLRALSQKAKTALEELGANILYLAFGFLEWTDSSAADAKLRLAPLFLLPARLEKGKLNPKTQTYEYALSYSGEEVITNLSLREKLRNDFALALPELEESDTPEAYFGKVTEMLKGNKPTWRVRRYISLSLLNFQKLLMYLDLDPSNWPDASPLVEHPIIKHFLVGRGPDDQAPDPAAFLEEYRIDELAEVESKFPLIDDADSSQHSALIDALEGKNLVIEGPPGTGKSQTITNLIAGAMARGKTVLFVAEKLAALEVVKQRLDRAGLGEFCLELHSHTSNKRQVIEDLEERFRRKGRHKLPGEIDAEMARHKGLKTQLAGHVERINKPWKKSGKNSHQLFAGAARYRLEIGLNPAAFHIDDCTGDSFTPKRRRELRDAVCQFADVRKALSQDSGGKSIAEHPWFGVENAQLQAFDRERVIERLQQWQDELQALWELCARIFGLFPERVTPLEVSLATIQNTFAALNSLPRVNGDEPLHALPHLRGPGMVAFAQHLELYNDLRSLYSKMAEWGWAPSSASNTAEIDAFAGACEAVGRAAHPQIALDWLPGYLDSARALDGLIRELEQGLSAVRGVVPAAAAERFSPNLRGIQELTVVIRLVAELKPGLSAKRDQLFDRDDFDEVFEALLGEHTAISEQARVLGELFNLDRLPDAETLESIRLTLASAGFFKWFSPAWRAARNQLIAFAKGVRPRPNELEPQLEALVGFVRRRAEFSASSRYQELLGAQFQGLTTQVENLSTLRAWYRGVRREYGVGFGPRVQIGAALLDLNEDVFRGLRALGDGTQLAQASALLDELQRAFPLEPALHDEQSLLIGEEGALLRMERSLRPFVGVFDRVLGAQKLTLAEAAKRAQALVKLREKQAGFDSSTVSGSLFAGRLVLDPREGAGKGLEAARQTYLLARWLDTPGAQAGIARRIYGAPTLETVRELEQLRTSIEAALRRERDAREHFVALTELDEAAWGADLPLALLRKRNQLALEKGPGLERWLDFLRGRELMTELGCGALVEAAQREQLPVDSLEPAFLAATFDQLAREVLFTDRELGAFSGTNHATQRRLFIEYDEKLKLLQREKIASIVDQKPVPPGSAAGKVHDLTDEALLKHEISKKQRHIPIRKLIARAGRAIAALKPCFMMGPMSVAQFLEPGAFSFDLIVMDEASQIRPQDALGAIARGKQIVVVGDPKQLPPTSFFEREVEVDEADATAIEESESILDATIPMFRQRRLRWHYRSKHEALIAFSNQSFYDGDLVLFPSPHQTSGNYGLHFSRVKTGVFSDQRNLEEARVVAEAVRNHVKNHPKETLGVVTMSLKQREQIERAIETLSKEDASFLKALTDGATNKESLFVKNLENVQGDERDVIFISMTYGPTEVGGRVFQRFGPINSDVGWRRLNVLFTRSRKRMHVFSSMGSSDIAETPSSPRGIRALRAFLEYCETRILAPKSTSAQRDPDSDFEVAVAQALRREGFECEPQVGRAGFFIDIGVKDPGNPARFLMGIECDGATYHSAKSVRDRDRLRQQILESLGWTIRRIWSTDWFRNPEGQLGPILKELHALKTVSTTALRQSTESQDIERIVERAHDEEQSVVRYGSTVASLRDQLRRFDIEVVRPETGDISEEQRLLRNEMIEALCTYKPTSRSEFLERIPAHLRTSVATGQGHYFDRVFAIISRFS